jgi:hypothetical protein
VTPVDWNNLDGVLAFPEGSQVVYAKGEQHAELAQPVALGEAIVVLPDGKAAHVSVRVETFDTLDAVPPGRRRGRR